MPRRFICTAAIYGATWGLLGMLCFMLTGGMVLGYGKNFMADTTGLQGILAPVYLLITIGPTAAIDIHVDQRGSGIILNMLGFALLFALAAFLILVVRRVSRSLR